MQQTAYCAIDRALGLVAVGFAAVALTGPVEAQQKGAADPIHGLNGSWERYPSRSAGLGSDAEKGPPGPGPIPDPPLKPEYLKDWQAKQAEIKKLTDEGLPPANNYSACLPDQSR